MTPTQLARPTLTLILAAALAASPALAGDPFYYGIEGSTSGASHDPMRVRQFPDQTITAFGNLPQLLTDIEFQCWLRGTRDGLPIRGARATLDATVAVLDEFGNVQQQLDLNPQRLRTRNNGYDVQTFLLEGFLNQVPGLASNPNLAFAANFDLRGNRRATQVESQCGIVTRNPCVPDAFTSCLQGDRFKVEVDFGGNPGQVFSSSNDEALFFLNNTDLLIQLLDQCGFQGPGSNHFWVFYAATTSVEFEITVTDTMSGESRVYDNPQGQPADAVTDVAAFATCP